MWFDKAQVVGFFKPINAYLLQDELTGATVHVYKGDYWKCKEKQVKKLKTFTYLLFLF